MSASTSIATVTFARLAYFSWVVSCLFHSSPATVELQWVSACLLLPLLPQASPSFCCFFQIFSCGRLRFSEIPMKLAGLLQHPDPIVINHVIR